MANARRNILIVAAAGLGALVWLQHTSDDTIGTSEPPVADGPGQLGAQAALDTRSANVDAESKQAGEPQLRNPLFYVRRESLKETVARPLFAPDRRPPRKPKPVVKRQPPPKPRIKKNYFRLLGVVRGEQGTIALLSDKRDGRYFRVGPGDYIDGWSIIRVDAEQVTMSHKSKTVTLSLADN